MVLWQHQGWKQVKSMTVVKMLGQQLWSDLVVWMAMQFSDEVDGVVECQGGGNGDVVAVVAGGWWGDGVVLSWE